MPTTVREPRIGRTPMWPEYIPRYFTDRTLAILKGDTLYVETGEYLPVNTFTRLVDTLFTYNLLAFTESVTSSRCFPWLENAVFDIHCKVLSSKDSYPTSIRFSRKSETRWVVPASTWERKIDAYFLSDMRRTFDYCGVGTKQTPGSLGQALLRSSWKKYHLAHHTAPNRVCQQFLWDNHVGGRCDTPGVGQTYASALELDMASGYLAHFLELPTGTARKFMRNDCWEFATFFCKCTVIIRKELALGCFPVKNKRKNIAYPTLPGTYHTHLWKEQIIDCIATGCLVNIEGGYGWEYFTYDTEDWCRYMYSLRIFAPDEFVEKDIKKATVAGIGRFGMHNTYYHLEADSPENEEYPCALSDTFDPLMYVAVEEKDYKQSSMAHWYSYCIMQCARTLYRYALPYAENGRLIMTNYDSILVLETDETHKYVEKHTLEAKMCELGDWRWQRLTNVHVLGSRSLTCDQKVVTPGVSHE